MNQIEDLEKKSIPKLLAAYSIPATVGLVVNSAYTMIDRAFVGNLPDNHGPLALAGVGVSMPITTFVIAISACIAMGSLANVSAELGRKNVHKANQLLGNAISISIVSGIVLTALFYLFKNQLFQLVGANASIIGYTDKFLSVLMLGTVFSILGFVIPILIRSNGSPLVATLVMVSGAIINILLDWLFIFKLNMGIEGPAVATIISQIFVTILGLLYLFRPKALLKPNFNDYRISKNNIIVIFSIGMVPMFNQLSVSVSQVIANWSLQQNGGNLFVSAMASVASVVMIVTMIVSGISQGSMPIISFNFGRQNMKRVRKTIITALVTCFIFLVVSTIVILLFSENIVSIFSQNAQLVKISSQGLRLYGFLIPLMTITTMLPGMLSLVGFPKIAAGINISKQLLIYTVFIVVLPLLLGNNGLWLSQPMTELVTTVISLYFAKRFLLNAIKDNGEELSYNEKLIKREGDIV